MQARSRLALYGSAFLTYAAAMLLVAVDARAHGDAAWIEANPRYVDQDGVQCCGPHDCHREQAVKFREAEDGVHVTTGAGDEVLMPRRLEGHGLYPSIDEDWWMCIRAGVVRCLFKPTTGG